MKEEIIDWLIICSKIIFWLLAVIVIYWIILKLTNHSPTMEEIILSVTGIMATVVLGIAGLVIKILIVITEMRTELKHHIKECDRRFYALAIDFKNTDSEFRKHMIRYHSPKYS